MTPQCDREPLLDTEARRAVEAFARMPQRPAHLLGIEGLGPSDVLRFLDRAEVYFEGVRRGERFSDLRGRTVVHLFYEASTRTRTSFEIAGKKLSADVINLAVSSSSASKGETLLDTCKTLEAMRPDGIVLRHESSGAPHFVAQRLGCAVINAGDGQHEHPTQALLDAFTIRKRKGTLEGLSVAICGDVMHSRVARSNALLLRLFGCDVRVVAPRTLMPSGIEVLGVRAFDRLEPALEGADVVMALRVQRERLQGAHLPSLREYSRTFGLSTRALSYAKPDALVMHPGPMNRGVEIGNDVADGPQSAVLDQVEAGIAVRMASLHSLLGNA